MLLERCRAGLVAGHAAGTVHLSLPERVRVEDPSVEHGRVETYRAANSASDTAKRPHKREQPAA